MLGNLNINLYLFLQATLQDLEQRRPQLEELITAAQNLKNKTSNQEARTIITDRSKSFNTHMKLKARCMKSFNNGLSPQDATAFIKTVQNGCKLSLLHYDFHP